MKRKTVPILTLPVMGFLFFESSLPGDVSSRQSGFFSELLLRFFHWENAGFWIRKAAHFTEFALLGALFALWFERLAINRIESRTLRLLIRRLLAFAAGALYGVSDEIHQIFVSGRSCEARDMAIDAAGVLAGVLTVSLILWAASKRRKTLKSGSETVSDSIQL